MNVISMLLVIAAAAALIGSFFRDDDLTLVFVSIGCCLAAFLFLFLGLLRSRPTRKPVLTGEAAQVPVPTTAPSATAAPAVAGPVVLPRVVEEPAAPVVEREVEGDQPWRREPVALDPDPDDTARVDLGARTRAPQPSAQGPVVVGPEPEEDEELFDDDDEALAEAPAPRKAPLAVPPPAPVTPRRAPARSGATRAGATRATATSAAGAAKSTAGAARTTKAAPAPAPAPTGLPSDRDIARVEQVLRGVPGVGPTRRRDLLAHFGTYRKLKNASTLRLMEVPGITPTLADRVRTALDQA